MTVDGRVEDQQDDGARTIIRSFWLAEIKGLRDQFDAERLRRNLGPVSNKEIKEATGIPESTLSELMSSKRDMVPDWERVSLIVGYLGGKSQDWVAKWRRARTAYDSLGKSSSPKPQPAPTTQTPPRPRTRKYLWIAFAGAVLTAGTWIVIGTQSDGTPDSSIQPANEAGAQCIRVRDETETVSVFKDPKSYDKWAEWPSKTRFRADIDETNPHRYRVLLKNGHYGYVNTDKKYVVSAKDCS